MPQAADSRQLVGEAQALLAAGKAEDAERLCREQLRYRPDDVNVLALLGAILLKRGHTDDAELLLRRSIALEPGFARPHEDLGSLFLQIGRPQDAIPFFENACRLDPQHPSASFGLATALSRAGRQAESDAARQRFLASSPLDRALQDAARLNKEGNSAQAEKICGEILSKDSRNVRALRLLADIAAGKERYAAAEGLLRRVVRVAPDFQPGYADLGEFLAARSRFPEAADVLGKAIALRPDLAGLHLKQADIFSTLNKPDQALAAYQRCIDQAPDNYAALMGCGHMQRVLGQREGAISSYLRCTELRADLGDAWWYLASIRGFRFTSEQRLLLQSQIESTQIDAQARIAMHFAFARACEAGDEFDLAWQHYVSGNEAMRQVVKYDPVELETQNDESIGVFSSELLQRLSFPARSDSRPIFIVGMPRSGSTLIEQILASHRQVDGCGELPYIIMLSNMLGSTYPGGARYPAMVSGMSTDDLTKIGSNYLEHSAGHRSGRNAYFTDKMPSNFLHVGLIHLALPQAIIIDVRRNPLDTCVANYRQLFAQGKNQTYDLTELAEYYLEYLRIMDHWDAVLPGRVLRLKYEDVVGDLGSQVRRILEHCNLPFDEACLNFHQNRRPVNTVSSEQVREPIYSDAVDYWKNYEPHLGELKEILAPVL